MKKRRVIAQLFISMFLTLSCAIEDFNSTPNLNTPLGLGAVYTTNSATNAVIRITFWGLNNETYFSGYEVFIAESLSDLTNEINSYRVLPNINGESNSITSNSTTIIANMTEATYFQYDISYDTNFVTLANITYYIWVKAYSATFGSYSLPSNWTNATYLNI